MLEACREALVSTNRALTKAQAFFCTFLSRISISWCSWSEFYNIMHIHAFLEVTSKGDRTKDLV